MGNRETPPPLPDIEPNVVEAEVAQVWTALRECNCVLALEGDDTSLPEGWNILGSRETAARQPDVPH